MCNNQKRAEVAILVSDTIDLKTKIATRYKKSTFIMIKGSIMKNT